MTGSPRRVASCWPFPHLYFVGAVARFNEIVYSRDVYHIFNLFLVLPFVIVGWGGIWKETGDPHTRQGRRIRISWWCRFRYYFIHEALMYTLREKTDEKLSVVRFRGYIEAWGSLKRIRKGYARSVNEVSDLQTRSRNLRDSIEKKKKTNGDETRPSVA